MAAGKTHVGSLLARMLGFRFVDLDREIESRAGEPVRAIFERRGEGHFRDLEHECLRRTASLGDAVIATGGGTMAAERNRDVIRRLGVSVWLDADIETLLARLRRSVRSQRPLFRDEAQARALYLERREAYRLADLRVGTASDGTAQSVAGNIALLLRERRCVI